MCTYLFHIISWWTTHIHIHLRIFHSIPITRYLWKLSNTFLNITYIYIKINKYLDLYLLDRSLSRSLPRPLPSYLARSQSRNLASLGGVSVVPWWIILTVCLGGAPVVPGWCLEGISLVSCWSLAGFWLVYVFSSNFLLVSGWMLANACQFLVGQLMNSCWVLRRARNLPIIFLIH